MDLNLSCPSSVHNKNFLRDHMNLDKRLHELMVFLKIWAKQLQLIAEILRPNTATTTTTTKAGVNYAYNFPNNAPTLPRNQTTSNLIQGFFEAIAKIIYLNHSRLV
ncbi:uncharacterized protein [Eurosta solidaginis]|uniref:uncharacterized protein isoform X2 n=1 Tax=Eurosta solidaginis TaxID=178769 RepID=UPI003530DEE6